MSFNISNETTIYILAPAGVATGGPELLHQLGFKIQSLLGHKNVFMHYIGQKTGINPLHESYEHYKVKISDAIIDNDKNIIIAPEIYTTEIGKYKKIQKSIWWLSVDNYYYNINLFYTIVNKLALKIFNSQKYIGFDKSLKKIPHHFVQSEYAKQHLIKKGFSKHNIFPLSDYLNRDFLDNSFNTTDKKNIIAYNPKKGYKFMKRILQYVNTNKINLKFIAIENMSRAEVIKLLKNAKIYIDLGYFPGKDRIPREASILGCIILTSKMGSAAYKEDFPFKDNFKIKNLKNCYNIIQKILELLKNYNKEVLNFKPYNNLLLSEEQNFDSSIKAIFKNNY